MARLGHRFRVVRFVMMVPLGNLHTVRAHVVRVVPHARTGDQDEHPTIRSTPSPRPATARRRTRGCAARRAGTDGHRLDAPSAPPAASGVLDGVGWQLVSAATAARVSATTPVLRAGRELL